MSTVERRRSGGVRTLDTVLVTAAVVGGILVVLWLAHAVIGLALFVFKVAILVVVIALIVRLIHVVTRRRG